VVKIQCFLELLWVVRIVTTGH